MTIAVDFRHVRKASKTDWAAKAEWLIIFGQLVALFLTIPAALIAGLYLQ